MSLEKKQIIRDKCLHKWNTLKTEPRIKKGFFECRLETVYHLKCAHCGLINFEQG